MFSNRFDDIRDETIPSRRVLLEQERDDQELIRVAMRAASAAEAAQEETYGQ